MQLSYCSNYYVGIFCSIQAQIVLMSGGENFRKGNAEDLCDSSPRRDYFSSCVRSLHKEKHKLLAKIK